MTFGERDSGWRIRRSLRCCCFKVPFSAAAAGSAVFIAGVALSFGKTVQRGLDLFVAFSTLTLNPAVEGRVCALCN